MDPRLRIVFGASLTQFTVIGLFVSSGLFFKVFEAEFGWSRSVLSAASALSVFMMGLLAIPGGRLSDRFGPRVVLGATGVAFGLGYALLSRVSEPWHLLVIFGLFLGLGFSTHDVVTLSTVARWFEGRRGIMTAVVKVGTALGQIAVPPVVALMLAGLGWRPAVTVLGLVSVLLLLIAVAAMKAPPAAKPAPRPPAIPEPAIPEPAIPQSPAAAAGGAEPLPAGLRFAEARRARPFWTLCAVQFLFFPTLMTLPLHLPAHGMDMGLGAPAAAALISVMGAASIAGRLAIGRLVDVIGGRNAYLVSLGVLIAALLPLLAVQSPGLLYAIVAIYGFSHGALFVVVSPTVAEFFGMRAHGAIFGVVIFAGTIGATVGPILAGLLYDRSGSYFYAFLTLLAMAAAAFLLVLSLPRPAARVAA